MLRNLLVYRLVIINLIWLVFLAYAWVNGWVSMVIEADESGGVWVMIGFAVIFAISLTNRAGKVAANLNALKRGAPVSVNGSKFLAKNAHLYSFPGWIAFTGLVCNVLGLFLALNGMSEAGINSASGAQEAFAQLMDGVGVAFSATIAGGVLAIWADINGRILKTATVLMIEDAKAAAP